MNPAGLGPVMDGLVYVNEIMFSHLSGNQMNINVGMIKNAPVSLLSVLAVVKPEMM